jgi:hypothetical protein
MSDDARLKTLLARMDIVELTHKVARAVDRCDVELFCSCFTNGGLFDAGMFNGTMPEVGRAMFAAIGDAMRRTQHHVSNHIILVDGNKAKGEVSVIGGRYLDEYRCEGGQWKVAARRIVVDYARTQKSTHTNAGAYDSTRYKGPRNRQDPSYRFVF